MADTADTAARLDELVASRAAGAPLEHVLGWAAFCGLRVEVPPGVFVPRPRTEALVEEAVRGAPPRPVVLDLCCGSGAIGLAIATRSPGTELVATDLDPAAVACAARNLAPVGGLALTGDLFQPVPPQLAGRVDVLAANVPYVPSEEIPFLPAEARDHEPRAALDGGPDGLAVLRRVASGAAHWLAPGGRVIFELAVPQLDAAREALTASGLGPTVSQGEERETAVVAARRQS